MVPFITALLLSSANMVSLDTIPRADTSQVFTLYSLTSRRHSDLQGEGYRFVHRKVLYEALHLKPGDADSIVSRRMQLGWQELSGVRASGAREPPVQFHQLLERSLREQYGPFLLDAVRWQVDLNYMDMHRKKTLMDELEEVFRNNNSTGHAEWLREYKQILQGAGAKYFEELNFRMRNLARKYSRIRPPVFGAYAVQRNGKWGWVDENNKTIIPLAYKAVRRNTRTEFEVSDDGYHFYLVKR